MLRSPKWLLLANGFFNFGYYFFNCFCTFYPKYTTGSASDSGVLLALIFVGNIIAEPISASSIDSGRSWPTIMSSAIASLIGSVCVNVAIHLQGRSQFLVFALASTAIGVASGSLRPFFYTEATKFKDLPSINANLMSVERLAMIAGLGLGVTLFNLLDVSLFALTIAILLMAAIISSTILIWAEPRGLSHLSEASLKQRIQEGFVFVFSNPRLRSIFVLLMVVNFLYPPTASLLLPYLVEDGLSLHYGWYSAALLIQGLSVIVGMNLVKKRVADRSSRRMLFCAGLVFLAVGLSAYAFAFGEVLLLMGSVLTGVGLSLTRLTSITHLQQIVPARVLSRAVGLLTVVASALVPLGMSTFGYLLDQTGHNAKLLLGVSSAGLIVASVSVYAWSSLRSFFDGELLE